MQNVCCCRKSECRMSQPAIAPKRWPLSLYSIWISKKKPFKNGNEKRKEKKGGGNTRTDSIRYAIHLPFRDKSTISLSLFLRLDFNCYLCYRFHDKRIEEKKSIILLLRVGNL